MPFKFFKQKLKIVNVDIGIKHNFVPICKDHYFVLGQHKPSLIKNYLSYCDWVSRFLISWFKRYLVCVEVKTFTITVAKKLAIFFYGLGELKSESNANATFLIDLEVHWSKEWLGVAQAETIMGKKTPIMQFPHQCTHDSEQYFHQANDYLEVKLRLIIWRSM